MSTVSLSPHSNNAGHPVTSHCSPWLTPLAYFLGEKIVVPAYFKNVEVLGQHHLPSSGPTILAPTHRARWDSIILPYAVGRSVTGRDLHFMVTSDEVKGIQGWFIRRLGGFAVNVRSPSISSLRHGIELLQQEKMLVIYPEGGIFRDNQVHRLKPGFARIALQAQAQSSSCVKIVPVSLRYDPLYPCWRSCVTVTIGEPIEVSSYFSRTQRRSLSAEDLKSTARDLTDHVSDRLASLSDTQSAH